MNSATFRLGYVCLAYLHSPPEIYEQDAEPASRDQGFGWEKISGEFTIEIVGFSH